MSSIHFVRKGQGKPILLVHGLGSSVRNWDPIVPALTVAGREVIALDLPGFGESPPLAGEVTIASLTDTVEGFIAEHQLGDVDVVGSSMGARMVLEMSRRGHAGAVIALDPGGFWTDTQVKVFGATVGASIALVRHIQPLLPTLTRCKVGRTALLLQFSAHPWRLDRDLVLQELRSFKSATSLDDALRALVHGPKQQGAQAGSQKSSVVIGWGRNDRVTLPSQSARRAGTIPRCAVALVRRLRTLPALGSARGDCATDPRDHGSRDIRVRPLGADGARTACHFRMRDTSASVG